MSTSRAGVHVWNKLTTADAIYLARASFLNHGYSILLTDLSNLWTSDAEELDILSLCQSLNPNVDAPLTTILQHLNTAFCEPEKINAVFTFDNQEVCELNMTSKLAGFPFKWNFYLEKDDSGKLAELLTIPMLMLVAELSRQQDQLVKLIRKKDSEIENYRMQGLKVTRKNLETKTFDADLFAEEMVVSEGFEKEVRILGLSALSTSNQTLLNELLKKRKELAADKLSLADAWRTDQELPTNAKPDKVESPKKKSPYKTVEKESQEGLEKNRKRALQEKLAKEGQKMEESKRIKKKLKL